MTEVVSFTILANYYADPAYSSVQDELTHKTIRHSLAHSRFRSFGGGKHPSDTE